MTEEKIIRAKIAEEETAVDVVTGFIPSSVNPQKEVMGHANIQSHIDSSYIDTQWSDGVAGGRRRSANLNFQEDIRDLAAQAGTHVGVVIPRSDEQVMQVVIQKAGEHGIELTPEQVTVKRASTGEHSTWYLAVDYTVPINLGVTSFHMHFAPTSERGGT